MQTPPLRSTDAPQTQPSETIPKLHHKTTEDIGSKGQESRRNSHDGATQTSAIFDAAAGQQQGHRRSKHAFNESGSRHILATSLTSRTAEQLEIKLPAQRVEGGWKAKISARENSQITRNLVAVRSDETGLWTMMPDRIEAAGQSFSQPRSFTKSAFNPVQGPFTSDRGAEIAFRMLRNFSHLNGHELDPETPNRFSAGTADAAENVLKAVMMTKGIPGQVYVYEVGGEPAAILKGKMRDDVDRSFHVNFVVSDPYARGAGTAMLEKAVNVSLENGGGGTVTLEANTAGAVDQYQKLGFERYSPFSPSVFETDLKLDPRVSDQWEKVGDQYTYVGDRGLKYVTGLGPARESDRSIR